MSIQRFANKAELIKVWGKSIKDAKIIGSFSKQDFKSAQFWFDVVSPLNKDPWTKDLYSAILSNDVNKAYEMLAFSNVS